MDGGGRRLTKKNLVANLNDSSQLFGSKHNNEIRELKNGAKSDQNRKVAFICDRPTNSMYSVTRMGDFLNFLGINFITKVAEMFGDFWATSVKHP